MLKKLIIILMGRNENFLGPLGGYDIFCIITLIYRFAFNRLSLLNLHLSKTTIQN